MKSGSFSKIIRRFRQVAGALPDCRKGKNIRVLHGGHCSFSLFGFFTQYPLLLSFQRAMEEARERNNARSLFEVHPALVAFGFAQGQEPGGPEAMFTHRRKARIFVPKPALRWWRLFVQVHYPKGKPGRPAKAPPEPQLSTA